MGWLAVVVGYQLNGILQRPELSLRRVLEESELLCPIVDASEALAGRGEGYYVVDRVAESEDRGDDLGRHVFEVVHFDNLGEVSVSFYFQS